MTSAPRRSKQEGTTDTVHHFRLFVAGDSPRSARAAANLSALCSRVLPGSHQIEVIDVLETVMSNSIAINSMMDPLVVRMRKLPRPLTLSLGSPGQLPLTAGGRV